MHAPHLVVLELNVLAVNALLLIVLLLGLENRVVEETLKLLVRVVNAELLEAVIVEVVVSSVLDFFHVARTPSFSSLTC